MDGVSKELIWVEDSSYDDVLLRILSPSNTKMVSLDTSDIGNLTVTVISIVFMRLQLFVINSRTHLWNGRASYSWASLLWFISFQKYTSKLIFNKGNMVLETVATIFLVAIKYVKKPRNITSEANEHTYGGWRSVLR